MTHAPETDTFFWYHFLERLTGALALLTVLLHDLAERYDRMLSIRRLYTEYSRLIGIHETTYQSPVGCLACSRRNSYDRQIEVKHASRGLSVMNLCLFLFNLISLLLRR